MRVLTATCREIAPSEHHHLSAAYPSTFVRSKRSQRLGLSEARVTHRLEVCFFFVFNAAKEMLRSFVVSRSFFPKSTYAVLQSGQKMINQTLPDRWNGRLFRGAGPKTLPLFRPPTAHLRPPLHKRLRRHRLVYVCFPEFRGCMPEILLPFLSRVPPLPPLLPPPLLPFPSLHPILHPLVATIASSVRRPS